MLVLARAVDESIDIGGQIVVKVLSVRNGKVRLGISAPVDVVVNRSEITARMEAERENGLSGRTPATDSAD